MIPSDPLTIAILVVCTIFAALLMISPGTWDRMKAAIVSLWTSPSQEEQNNTREHAKRVFPLCKVHGVSEALCSCQQWSAEAREHWTAEERSQKHDAEQRGRPSLGCTTPPKDALSV